MTKKNKNSTITVSSNFLNLFKPISDIKTCLLRFILSKKKIFSFLWICSFHHKGASIREFWKFLFGHTKKGVPIRHNLDIPFASSFSFISTPPIKDIPLSFRSSLRISSSSKTSHHPILRFFTTPPPNGDRDYLLGLDSLFFAIMLIPAAHHCFDGVRDYPFHPPLDFFSLTPKLAIPSIFGARLWRSRKSRDRAVFILSDIPLIILLVSPSSPCALSSLPKLFIANLVIVYFVTPAEIDTFVLELASDKMIMMIIIIIVIIFTASLLSLGRDRSGEKWLLFLQHPRWRRPLLATKVTSFLTIILSHPHPSTTSSYTIILTYVFRHPVVGCR